ncbi:MAG: MBL fold metallo-hydrolase RNA specificity domain-containing protein [Candidatus Micrarchaeia archaeon]
MKIHVLGAGREVGRSMMLVETEGKKIALDAGIKVKDQDMEVTGLPKLDINVKVDAALIGHAHLDHSGFSPELYRRYNTPFFMTIPTQGLADLLIKDAKKIDPQLPYERNDIDGTFNKTVGVPYGMEHSIGSVKFTYYDAGHIPGSAMMEIKTERKRLFYTSDFKLDETRLLSGATIPEGRFDALIIESTYAKRYHPPRRETERKIINIVKKTLNDGGNVLFPTFAVGRTQELAMVLADYQINAPIFIDGMGKTASEITMSYPRYVKNPGKLKNALENLKPVGKNKNEVLKEPSIIIATSGMLEGGPAISYLLALNEMKKREDIDSSVIFTGYCVEGTGGWLLQNKQMVKIKPRREGGKTKEVPINLNVFYEPLSAHAGRNELFKFIETIEPEKIICVHGDDCEGFASELKENGYDAIAPDIGETIQI